VKNSHKNKHFFGEKITCIHVLGVEEVKQMNLSKFLGFLMDFNNKNIASSNYFSTTRMLRNRKILIWPSIHYNMSYAFRISVKTMDCKIVLFVFTNNQILKA